MKVMNVVEEKKNVILKALSVLAGVTDFGVPVSLGELMGA